MEEMDGAVKKPTTETNNDNSETIEYVRRLDRTPERDFHIHNEEEKKIICKRRLLTQKVKDKIDKLEDEVEARLDDYVKSIPQLYSIWKNAQSMSVTYPNIYCTWKSRHNK